jgi:hypothetical protein
MNDFFSAGIANAIQMVVGYPLDTAKVWVQSGCKEPMTLRNLYGGIRYPLVGHSAMTGLCFSTYDYGIRNSYGPLFAGFVSGSLVSVIAVPFEVMKITKQYEPASVVRMNSKLCIRCLPAIYARETSYITMMLNLQHWFSTQTDISPTLYGALCSSVSWIMTYPLDTYKTHTVLLHSLGKTTVKRPLFDIGLAYSIIRVSCGGSLFMTIYTAIRTEHGGVVGERERSS